MRSAAPAIQGGGQTDQRTVCHSISTNIILYELMSSD